MQPHEFDKAAEYAREMKRMAEISDINHIYKQNYNSDSRSNNNCNTNSNIKHIFNQFNSSSANSNNDISLILALIILLSSDSGDKMLILALLYIMT